MRKGCAGTSAVDERAERASGQPGKRAQAASARGAACIEDSNKAPTSSELAGASKNQELPSGRHAGPSAHARRRGQEKAARQSERDRV